MNLVLDIACSVEFWRQRYPAERTPLRAQPLLPTNCAFRKHDIEPLIPEWITDEFLAPTDGVLHLLSFDNSQKRLHSDVTVHAWTGPIPEGSFYELSSGIWVESPAFMFLQAASILDQKTLIAFGDELCGLYSFDRRDVKRGFRKRERPLLTIGQLTQFVHQAGKWKYQKRAQKALKHIVANSASPMETLDEMTICLPGTLGGYLVTTPIMNEEVHLEGKAARIARREKCYLDMGYASKHLDVEHHGKNDHSSPEQMDSDRARVNGLKEMGFEVIELTKGQVYDLEAYECIIKRIARILDIQLNHRALGHTQQRCDLRRRLFEWNKSSGKIR